MSEEEVVTPPPAEPEADEDLELLGSSVTVGADGKRTINVPLDTVIGLRKSNRELGRKVKDLEPVAARVKEVDEKLTAAQPIINAILTNPQLRAQALRGTMGQDAKDIAEQVDEDAKAAAEDFGFYLADGYTPDVAKGRKVLQRMGGIAKRESEEATRPLASMTLSTQGEANVARVLAQTRDDGTPYATAESIREAAQMIGPQLLANPQVANMLLTQAIGMDAIKGRTPKAVEEPVYLERAGSRRGRTEVVYTEEDRARHQRLGISEQDAKRAEQQLRTGRAITFEGA
jgi:hypothetical protein